mgnify:CR=1 FL=1
MFQPSLVGSDTQLNRQSWYEASVERGPALPPLQERLQADAVVVGAGFSGLSAALELAQRGLSRAGGGWSRQGLLGMGHRVCFPASALRRLGHVLADHCAARQVP